MTRPAYHKNNKVILIFRVHCQLVIALKQSSSSVKLSLLFYLVNWIQHPHIALPVLWVLMLKLADLVVGVDSTMAPICSELI